MSEQFRSFGEFYPFYLQEHANRHNRVLHFLGTTLVLLLFALVALNGQWRWLLLAPLCGYGFAWAGHYFFEKNRPATFTHPFYSFAGDWVMWKDLVTGKVRF